MISAADWVLKASYLSLVYYLSVCPSVCLGFRFFLLLLLLLWLLSFFLAHIFFFEHSVASFAEQKKIVILDHLVIFHGTKDTQATTFDTIAFNIASTQNMRYQAVRATE